MNAFISILTFLLIISVNTLQAQKAADLKAPKQATQVDNDDQSKQPADTLYASEDKDYFVIGDLKTKQINSISIKFKPHVLFSDFALKPALLKKDIKIDWTSHGDAKRFKTRLSETCKSQKINFAGHYCFVYWGCGSECQVSLVVDALTGKVYDGLGATAGFDFKPDSRMVLVNPPDSTGFFSDCSYSKPVIYIWDEQNKTFIER